MGVVDLFSGAGGLSEGLHKAGLATLLGSDFWPAAAESYQANHPSVPYLQVDDRDLTSQDLLSAAGRPPEAIVGGPPCQGFSSAGPKNGADLRNSLVGVFASLIAEVRPPTFVFENVEGFLTSTGGDYVVALLDPLIEAGYKIVLEKLNVANYGVPQLRKRTIAIGSLNSVPVLPTATHRAFGSPGSARIGHSALPTSPTVADALAGMPPASTRRDAALLLNHWFQTPREFNALRYKSLQWGQTMRDLPSDLQHESYIKRANRRVADGTPTERRGGAPAGIRKLKPDEPSRAITSAAYREFIHPFEDRPLTLRECARLQTFPDEYRFIGNNSETASLIGNAIPVLFASALGWALKQTLAADDGLTSDPGRLVRFQPTASNGMSPALASVTERVVSRYQRRASQSDELTLWR